MAIAYEVWEKSFQILTDILKIEMFKGAIIASMKKDRDAQDFTLGSGLKWEWNL